MGKGAMSLLAISQRWSGAPLAMSSNYWQKIGSSIIRVCVSYKTQNTKRKEKKKNLDFFLIYKSIFWDKALSPIGHRLLIHYIPIFIFDFSIFRQRYSGVYLIITSHTPPPLLFSAKPPVTRERPKAPGANTEHLRQEIAPSRTQGTSKQQRRGTV